MADKTVEQSISRNQTGVLNRASIGSLIEKNSAEIAKALPKHLTVERMTKVMLLCIDKTPDLLKCTQSSLISALMQCAELGLEPGGVRGLAYLIPYRNNGEDLNRTCTLIVGYKGLIQLALRSNHLQQIEARVVHGGDQFAHEFGLQPRLRHVPALDKPGQPIAVYALARLKNGQTHVEVMTWAEVMAIKARSKSSGDGPWVTDPEQMARKTCIRRLANYVELSPELADAMTHLGDEFDEPRTEVEVTAPPPPGKASKKAKAAPEDADTAEPEALPEHNSVTGEVTPAPIAETVRQVVEVLGKAPEAKPTPPKSEPVDLSFTAHDPNRPPDGSAEHAAWLGEAFDRAKTVEDLKWLVSQNTKVHELHAPLLDARYRTAKAALEKKAGK